MTERLDSEDYEDKVFSRSTEMLCYLGAVNMVAAAVLVKEIEFYTRGQAIIAAVGAFTTGRMINKSIRLRNEPMNGEE